MVDSDHQGVEGFHVEHPLHFGDTGRPSVPHHEFKGVPQIFPYKNPSVATSLITIVRELAPNTAMARHFIPLFSSLLLILVAMKATQAVEYAVTNDVATAGGVLFRDKIGEAYAMQTLDSATQFIWRIFQQDSPAERKNVQKVSFFVEDTDGVAYTDNNEIHLSARYVGNYKGDARREVSGVLYHEMTHVWQWNGNGQANGGVIEGIADYVRLKAGYAPSHWVKPGQGDKWDHGYEVTAYFLDYCNSLRNGFVAELNEKMQTGYSDDYFMQLLGKPVDQLWKDYKAKYGN